MRLDEAIEEIVDAAVAVVEAADLDGVRSVVSGDRARPMPALPSVWVVPQRATQTRIEYGDEGWSLPLSIAALVKSEDPVTGAQTARQTAALARSAVLAARRDLSTSVHDVTSTSFDPTARPIPQNRNLYYVEAVVTVAFTVTE